MNAHERQAAVAVLAESRLRPRSLPALSETWPSLRFRDAYPIQSDSVDSWIAEGRSVAGYKILITRLDLMKKFRTPEPAFGRLLDDAVLPSHSTVSVTSVVRAETEPEVAIVVGRDITEMPRDRRALADAVEYVTAAIEVPTGHMPWLRKARNVVADNGGAGYAVIGAHRTPPQATLAGRSVKMIKNGRDTYKGSTDAVLGDPMNAFEWLVGKLLLMRLPLRAGHVVITGSCIPSIAVAAGDSVEVEVEGLGSVTVAFQ